MKKISGLLGLTLMMMFILSSCRSTKSAQKGGDINTTITNTSGTTKTFSSTDYFQLVQNNQSKEKNLTARLKVTIQMNGKSLSTSGSLKMKKNDVIQISMVDPIVGIAEVGRMEFTKDRVLDRYRYLIENRPELF